MAFSQFTDEELDKFQLGLAATGMTPGPQGIAADIADAGISFGRGHWLSGLLALGSAIPIAGVLIRGGQNAMKRLLKGAQKAKIKPDIEAVHALDPDFLMTGREMKAANPAERYVYHVTPTKNIKSINEDGIFATVKSPRWSVEPTVSVFERLDDASEWARARRATDEMNGGAEEAEKLHRWMEAKGWATDDVSGSSLYDEAMSTGKKKAMDKIGGSYSVVRVKVKDPGLGPPPTPGELADAAKSIPGETPEGMAKAHKQFEEDYIKTADEMELAGLREGDRNYIDPEVPGGWADDAASKGAPENQPYLVDPTTGEKMFTNDYGTRGRWLEQTGNIGPEDIDFSVEVTDDLWDQAQSWGNMPHRAHESLDINRRANDVLDNALGSGVMGGKGARGEWSIDDEEVREMLFGKGSLNLDDPSHGERFTFKRDIEAGNVSKMIREILDNLPLSPERARGMDLPEDIKLLLTEALQRQY